MTPRKIQHLISSSTGGLGTDVLRAGERIAGIGPETKDLPANIPVVGRLFARTETAERRTRRIEFELKEEEQKIKNLYKAGKIDEATKRREQWNSTHKEKKFQIASMKVIRAKAIESTHREIGKLRRAGKTKEVEKRRELLRIVKGK